jgi:hypothetical protein
MAKVLLDTGADVNHVKCRGHTTLIMTACGIVHPGKVGLRVLSKRPKPRRGGIVRVPLLEE